MLCFFCKKKLATESIYILPTSAACNSKFSHPHRALCPCNIILLAILSNRFRVYLHSKTTFPPRLSVQSNQYQSLRVVQKSWPPYFYVALSPRPVPRWISWELFKCRRKPLRRARQASSSLPCDISVLRPLHTPKLEDWWDPMWPFPPMKVTRGLVCFNE